MQSNAWWAILSIRNQRGSFKHEKSMAVEDPQNQPRKSTPRLVVVGNHFAVFSVAPISAERRGKTAQGLHFPGLLARQV
jgi:hypothetical protein